MSLIRNIDVDSIKQALLETFVQFAEKVKCKIIAEGIESVVVLEDGKPIGLVMRFQLYKILGGPYGIPLYYERPVSHIMNTNPLTAKKDDKIDDVAKRAMARDSYHLYDVVIITGEEEEYVGIITVQSLLDKLASIKLELATSANPLTGLPGNLQIERVLDHRLRRNEAQTVIYCDLDRFKWFNDRYGFEVGDQIIVRTAALLKEGVKRFGTHHDFIGHIGGDDFIVITTPECAEPIVAFLIEQFGSYFADIYEKRRVSDDSILSMSMAGVSLLPGRFGSVEEIAQQAAWVKRLAKERPGTVFVSDQDRECAEANDSGRDWTRAEQRGKMGAL